MNDQEQESFENSVHIESLIKICLTLVDSLDVRARRRFIQNLSAQIDAPTTTERLLPTTVHPDRKFVLGVSRRLRAFLDGLSSE